MDAKSTQDNDQIDDHEIRIALVLNGGLSLAVWMSGVTYELDLIRRACGGADLPTSRGHDEALADRWHALCARGGTRRRIVVDVIAGSSAGGVNGTLLATAIAHRSTLDPDDGLDEPWLRRKWAELGSLEVGKLVPAAGRASSSVLDGDFVLEGLNTLLTEIVDAGSGAPEPVTLFATASGLGAQQYEAEDAAGRRFAVPDHRYLFAFTSDRVVHYDGRSRLFSVASENGLADTRLLALAARASASFPVAFAPVLETPNLAATPPRQRPAGRPVGPHAWLVDGGVLDNAPFGPVLDVVARRPVFGRASRYVLYVVPFDGGAGPEAGDAVLSGSKAPDWRSTALAALRFPSEMDFRSDVEQLEQLLMGADASWSGTQRLFERCCADSGERDRLQAAASLLQPVYVRGRAADGVWQAVTAASDEHPTALTPATALSEDDLDQILAGDHPWVPVPNGSTEPLLLTPDRPPQWPWGADAAERVVRLVLRSLRTRVETADNKTRSELKHQLGVASDVLQRVQAVREALTDELTKTDLDIRPAGGAEAVGVALAELFDQLQVRRTLGEAVSTLMVATEPTMVRTALEVEIVTGCTSTPTPEQRSAPFRFHRLGPDVELPLLDDLPEGTIAGELRERLLYGAQLLNFGAFGAAEWRRWDWLIGRLHGVAHIGALLGADTEWIRETQRQVLVSENWTLDAFAGQVRVLADSFPPGSGLGALTVMRDDLNESPEGRATIQGLADRLIDVSAGLGPQVGELVKAAVARQDTPRSWPLELVRWFARPARRSLWARLVREVELGEMRQPVVFRRWLPMALIGLSGLLLVGGLEGAPGVAIPAAVLAGLLLAAAVGLLGVGWFVRRARRGLARWVEDKLAPIGRS